MIRQNAILCFMLQVLISVQCLAQVLKVEKFVLEGPRYLGLYNGSEIYEGSLGSGISYIPGSQNEFYMMTDRGPNIFGYKLLNSSPATLIIFPSYSPKVFRAKLENNKISILQYITIKRPDSVEVTGIPFFDERYIRSEIPIGYSGETELMQDKWSIDPEGISAGSDSDFWVCEEYRPSILHIDSNGYIIKRYVPFPSTEFDLPLDTVLAYRLPNRGFEAITMTPAGKIYAVLQSPLGFPYTSVGVASRMCRIVELNPSNNEVKMFPYMLDKPPGKLTAADMKIGDIAAINNNEFLIIEQGIREDSYTYKIYKINISLSSPVTNNKYKDGYLEELDSANLISNDVIPVTKNLYLDLANIGWGPELEKCEGLTIINDSTIAVMNDNDFGFDYRDMDNIIVSDDKKSVLFKIYVTGSMKLEDYASLK